MQVFERIAVGGAVMSYPSGIQERRHRGEKDACRTLTVELFDVPRQRIVDLGNGELVTHLAQVLNREGHPVDHSTVAEWVKKFRYVVNLESHPPLDWSEILTNSVATASEDGFFFNAFSKPAKLFGPLRGKQMAAANSANISRSTASSQKRCMDCLVNLSAVQVFEGQIFLRVITLQAGGQLNGVCSRQIVQPQLGILQSEGNRWFVRGFPLFGRKLEDTRNRVAKHDCRTVFIVSAGVPSREVQFVRGPGDVLPVGNQQTLANGREIVQLIADENTLDLTETVYRGEIWPFGKTLKSLGKMHHLPDDLATELKLWKPERKMLSEENVKPDAFMFPNGDGGFMDTSNYRSRVLKHLADSLSIPKLNFRAIRRTIATRSQGLGSVKDIQSHLRHSRAETTANEYMQELPESVQQMIGTVFALLNSGKGSQMVN